MNKKNENALVPRPPRAIEKAVPGAKRILSGMVSDTLALASREQRTLSLLKYRIGDYKWCESDYLQILIWARETGLQPEEVVARLLDQQSLRDQWEAGLLETVILYEEPLFADGRLLKVIFHLQHLRCSRLEWVNGLEITHLQVLGPSDAVRLNDIGSLPLPRLINLHCCGLGLTHLNLTGVPQLECLDCSENDLAELKFDQTPNLYFLNCWGNKLTQLDLSGLNYLFELLCDRNKLTELKLAGLPQLGNLQCQENCLHKLDLTKVPKLGVLDCRGNHISILDLSQCPKLEYLNCADNDISELDLSPCTNLLEVDCSGNPISILDIRGLKHLRKLNRSSHTKVMMDSEQECIVQDLEAQFQMGVNFYHGIGVHSNHIEAAKFFRLAGESRHSSAQTFLGYCYYWGHGVPQDYSEAAKWFQAATYQGENAAQLNLATCYDLGHGVQQEYARAAKLYTVLAHRGWSIARARLGLAFLYGKGVLKDEVEAYKWLKLAAEQGNKDKDVAWAELASLCKGLIPILLLNQDKGVAWAEELASLSSTLSSDELQEGERRYREFKASH